VSHPSLGRPPSDPTAGHRTAAATLRADRERIAGRVLEAFVADDPTARERYDELAMRRLLRDVGTMLDQLSGALATADSTAFLSLCEALVPVYRRRGVPMDDLARLTGLLSKAAAAVLPLAAASAAATVLEAAGRGFKANRRLGGDAKKRNPVVAFIYKGA
jgi:hypothetical protein